MVALLAPAGVALGEGPLAGQVAAEGGPPPKGLVMDEVVVSASRFEELAAEVPNRVVVVPSSPEERSRTADLGQLLLGRSSFDVRNQGNPGSVQSISLRGASTAQVLVMVDGRPVNSVTLGMANLTEVSLDQIERVEVIEGPYSHLWGSGAVGGVVNVITRRPPDRFSASASAAYGSANSQLYSASVGDTVGDRKFGYLLMGGSHLSDGFRPNSDLEAYNGAGKFTLRAGDVDLSLFSNVYQQEIGVPGAQPDPARVLAGQVPLGNFEVTNLTERNRNLLVNNTLVAETSPAEGLTLRGRFFQDLRELSDFGRKEFFFLDPGGAGVSPFKDRFDTLIFGGSLEAGLERGVSRATLGVDWHYDAAEVTKRRTLDSGQDISLPGFDKERTSFGFFARERYQVSQPLALFVGGRIDYDTTFGTEFNPDAGLLLTIGRTALRGSVARVYRAPSFNELFWQDPAWSTFGNPDLKPETGWGSEVGVRREIIPGRLAADLSLFYWQIDHKITWRTDPATFASRPENLDEQVTKGATLSVAARPTEALELQAAYTYLAANQQRTGLDWVTFTEQVVRQRADLIPRHQVTWLAAYAWQTGTRAYVRGLYMSERRSSGKPGEPLEPVVLLWAGASQRLRQGVEVFFEAENLLDEDYSLAAGFPADGDFPAPPLNFLGGLRLSY